MFRYFILISSSFLALVFSLDTTGQNDSLHSSFATGLRVHYGFIIPHSETIQDQSFSNPWATELELSWHLNKEKTWQNFGTFPRVGTSLLYIDFDNPKILGQGVGIVPFIEPFLFVNRRLNASFRFGVGLVYLNQIYNIETNPENLFYSTNLSFLLNLNFGLNYQINPNWRIRLAGYYNHISNGGVKEPNKGINFPTASLGVEYVFNPITFPNFSKRNWKTLYGDLKTINLVVFGSATNVAEGDDRRYPLGGIDIYYKQIFGRMSSFLAGSEWLLDGASQEKSKRNGESISLHKVSLTVGHELILGKFLFSQRLGFYLFNERATDSNFYQRLGLSYLISRRTFLGINLKTHGDVADFLDFRLGYAF